jgi:hypothetical protein
MNREILEKFGFTKEMQLVENRQCPLCEARININDFKDELSLKEFTISGMCQECQDRIFAEPEE